ncbi:MAG: (deoxy)nucleoside triphosphate pyrophosphohydrolase [Ruminococcaceae bacterium]|nr:(deoxy)nucleoside triphosphate pyrophosphohydrolase [Oscillospiraceae bacterium]
MSLRDVTAAVLTDEQGRALLCRRPPDKRCGNLWEFPGGKLEPGETLFRCLERECAEELDIVIAPQEELAAVESGGFLIHYIRCTTVSGQPVLREHTELAWLLPTEMQPDTMCPADAQFLREWLLRQ